MLLAISKKRLRLQFKGGFNSRAASNGDFTVFSEIVEIAISGLQKSPKLISHKI